MCVQCVFVCSVGVGEVSVTSRSVGSINGEAVFACVYVQACVHICVCMYVYVRE